MISCAGLLYTHSPSPRLSLDTLDAELKGPTSANSLEIPGPIRCEDHDYSTCHSFTPRSTPILNATHDIGDEVVFSSVLKNICLRLDLLSGQYLTRQCESQALMNLVPSCAGHSFVPRAAFCASKRCRAEGTADKKIWTRHRRRQFVAARRLPEVLNNPSPSHRD
ncbi:hypothetical protein VTI28DRAFT_5224 [Corynascus sepedonium]